MNVRLSDAWNHVELLYPMVLAACGSSAPLSRIFASALHYPDDSLPELGKLKAALEAFYAQPEDEQRRILRGWTPVPPRDRQGLKKTREQTVSQDHCRALWLRCDIGHRPYPDLDMGFFATLERVVIQVKEGTPRDVVEAALLGALEMIRSHWSNLVDPARCSELSMAVFDMEQVRADNRIHPDIERLPEAEMAALRGDVAGCMRRLLGDEPKHKAA